MEKLPPPVMDSTPQSELILNPVTPDETAEIKLEEIDDKDQKSKNRAFSTPDQAHLFYSLSNQQLTSLLLF